MTLFKKKTKINILKLIFKKLFQMSLVLLKASSAEETFVQSTTNRMEDISVNMPKSYQLGTTDFNRKNLLPLPPPKRTSSLKNVPESNHVNGYAQVKEEKAYLMERKDSDDIYGTPKLNAEPRVRSVGESSTYVNSVSNLYQTPNERALNTGEFFDQIPRPPPYHRLQIQRRQDDDVNNNIDRPRPFHIPPDYEVPAEFKKPFTFPKPYKPARVNNIEDILQQLHIDSPPSSYPQRSLYPPGGLHIEGSFKNFKDSGILKFFHPIKRNNLHFATTMDVNPVPIQRVSHDPFHPFKPISPNDINLLAIRQQIFNNHRSKKKLKLPSTQLWFQQPNQYPIFDPSSQLVLMQKLNTIYKNNSRTAKAKKVPFSLAMDMYAVPNDYKVTTYAPGTTHQPMLLNNHIQKLYQYPPRPPVLNLLPLPSNFHSNDIQNFKSLPQMDINYLAQPSDMYASAFSPHIKYTPAVVQYPLPVARQQYSPKNLDDSNSPNHIMVHLNVFPKGNSQESSSHTQAFQPNEIQDRVTLNEEQNSECDGDLDFEHPIVAEEAVGIGEAVRANKNQSTLFSKQRSFNNYTNSAEMTPAEAQTSSLFRFPVENLLKFQVKDAM